MKIEIYNKELKKLMNKDIKAWLKNLTSQEYFQEMRDDFVEYLDELCDERFISRMENTHCSRCKCLGVRVEIRDVGNEDTKMLCRECFDKI